MFSVRLGLLSGFAPAISFPASCFLQFFITCVRTHRLDPTPPNLKILRAVNGLGLGGGVGGQIS